MKWCPCCKIKKQKCDAIIFSDFRHGIFKNNLKQIDPHTPKVLCDLLKSTNQIIGCGKPFKLIDDKTGATTAVKCEYI